ncbi:tetratricopeptide repeat-containing sulfotransferase family protein [Allosphingosinicella humi]
MTQPPETLIPALACFRRGDLPGAREAVEAALADEPNAPPLLEFAGLVASRLGDADAAIVYNRRLLSASPGHKAARINLVAALIASGDLDAAEAVCASGGNDPALSRLAGYVHQQKGRWDEAIAAYKATLAAAPGDFESWNNLGNTYAAKGDRQQARFALERAVQLRPDIPSLYLNLSPVLGDALRFDARQALMREAARRWPEDPEVQLELGLAEASARDLAAAVAALREAIRLRPGFTAAYLELGLLLENMNKVDALAALTDAGEAEGMPAEELGFLKAWVLRRRGHFAEALPLAEQTPPSIHPIRRAQLLAEVNDRLGNSETAFAAFAEMNDASLAMAGTDNGPSYREEVAANAALVTRERIAAWTPVDVDLTPPSPIFIVGFPRSGTTLLDTLLMNLPNLHVLEEIPVLHQVAQELGDEGRLASLTSAQANAMRARYFEVLETLAPASPGQRIVDKNPLHMTQMPLIHRIFPDAKVVLVERHPCDAVLSCFMANFSLNRAMRSFVDLEEAARTYDAVFDAWTRATAFLPIDRHHIRYERMVGALEGEMRSLLAFLDIPWDPQVLDNRGSAAKREHIRTASYSQVTEPIYQRAAGRWERYRAQMHDVLGILAPWAERMDYPV